ncbi:PREDICTED: transient receptor potential cation channel subfamily A member 1 homolog, partial [Amphimedon queenslandica]|uniref:Ion transport domain-containing protein n=1 Tax=Amphimedon queenslandica TaxID=400682 RepID=A0AAN0IR85_AMPQE
MAALVEDDHDTLQKEPETGGSEGTADDRGRTSLHRACKDGNYKAVAELLQEKAVDINAISHIGFTPLHYACEGRGDKGIVQLLIQKSAGCLKLGLNGIEEVPIPDDPNVQSKVKEYINRTDNLKRTPLGIACYKGHKEIVKLLLEHGADFNVTDNDGNTPLTLCISACIEGHTEIVELLLKHGANVNVTNNNGNTPLTLCISACIKEDKEIVELLLKHGANFNVTDDDGNTPLGIACIRGHEEAAKLLLKHAGVGINCTNVEGNTPLNSACIEGHTEIVKLLLEYKANVNVFNRQKVSDTYTPLGSACYKRHTEIVKLLLEKDGVEVNVTDNDGNTPLGIACKAGHTGIVKILLLEQNGVYPFINDTNKQKRTPLGIACVEGHTEIVKLLLEHGANVNVTDNYGNTPLSSACNTGHTEIVKLLLKQDVDEKINALDVAVVLGRRDAAMAIVKSDKWEDALCSYEVGDANVLDTIVVDKSVGDTSAGDTSGDDRIFSKLLKFCKNKRKDAITTPMRRVIEKMPDVAKVVFDRCCETKGSPYDNDYEITYNYEFLEDFDLDDRQTQPSHLKSDNNDCKRSKWPPQSRYSSQNHCLNILANSPSADLLKHPLAATLLDQKWNKYGRIVYYTNLIFYFLFVILLTSFALTVHPPNSSKCMEILGNDTDTFIDCFSEGRSAYVSIASVFVIVYSIIMLIRELAQVIQFKLEYLSSFVNYIEVPLFILTIMFTSVRSNQCYCTHSWQWQVGVIAVFLSWIALVFSIRKLPVVGIYVVMFIKIFNNFIKVVVLALLLISAFAFPLYMMFYNPQDRTEGIRTPFITPWRTIIKTITMTMGEYDMDSLLRQDDQRNAPDVQYPVVTFSLIIVFVVLMPILFLNLLIGLAVGDIEEIRKSADAYRRTLRVEFTLPIEEFLRTISNAKRLPKK